MIPANELGIGNLVNVPDKNLEEQIIIIGIVDSYKKIIKGKLLLNIIYLGDVSFERILPILLTEEWLLKFGFGIDKNNSLVEVCTKYFLEFRVSPNSDYVNRMIFHIAKREMLENFGYYSVNGNWGSINFKYVHQLQNLFFALTGKELRYEGYNKKKE